MSDAREKPERDDDLPGTPDGKAAAGDELAEWSANQLTAGSRGWRLGHLMWAVAAVALILWLFVSFGGGFIVLGILILFTMGISVGVIRAQRGSTQQDSLLFILAIAAERGMPLGPTVAAFADQYGGRHRRRILDLALRLDTGDSLPDALEVVPRVVSRDAALLARLGQETGRLPQALRMAASSRAAHRTIWAAIAGRLAYLLGLLLIMQAIFSFLLYFILPKFEAIFRDFGVPLPSPTVFLIEFSHFVMKYFFLTVWIVPLEVLLLVSLPFSFAGWANHNVPFLGRLFRRRHSALVLRALSLLVESERPIEQGLAILADHYPTRWVKRRLIRIEDDVQRGASWIESMERHGLLRAADAEVLNSAARLGNLGWAMRELAEAGERRLAFRFQSVIQTLFPFVVICLGLVVLSVALAFFAPLVELIRRLS